MRWLALAVLWLVGSLPAQQWTLPSAPVVFGQAFEFTIVVASGFDDAQLLPLQVELLSRTARGGQEERRYRARCYEVGEVILAVDPPQKLTVATSLPDPPGALEWPSDGWEPQAEASSRWWLYALAALVGVSAVVLLRRRTQPADVPVVATSAAETWDALAALEELNQSQIVPAAYYLQLKAIVRKHCATRFHLPAEVRTSEELMSALPAAKQALQPCLQTCDMVLFGGAAAEPMMLDDSRRVGAHDHALQFVKATQSRAVEVSA